MNRVLLVMAAVTMTATAARAQELNLANVDESHPHRVQLRTGLEHAFVAGLGYRYVIPAGDRPLLVGFDATLPWASPDWGDWLVRASAGAPILAGENLKLSASVARTLRSTDNSTSRMLAVGADVRLVGGWYARGGFIAAEAGVDWVAATHVRVSNAYRTRVYAGAQDGWYGLPGGTHYAGLQGGVSFSKLDLVARVGETRSTALTQQAVPFYLSLGVNLAM